MSNFGVKVWWEHTEHTVYNVLSLTFIWLHALFLTIKTHIGVCISTSSIIPTRGIYCTTLLMPASVVRLIKIPWSKTSQWLIPIWPAPAVDIIVQSDPSSGSKSLCLYFILKLDHVVTTLDDSQVGVFSSTVSLSIAPCFCLQDQIVFARDRKDEGCDSCGGEM